jgi:NAD(P)-dependent dehydrogenase (short-subunit alcohol dehydrogenase family)
MHTSGFCCQKDNGLRKSKEESRNDLYDIGGIKLNKPVALVTGSSSGFGLLTVLELAKSGFYVIASMRNCDKSIALVTEMKKQQIDDKNVNIFSLDITSINSIEALKDYLKTLGRIDVLVNNAGFALGGFCEQVSIDEYKEQLETNFFGHIAVTQAVLPWMRKQGSGKIINVSSISGLIGFPGLSPYVSSKFALEGWSECLRLELKPFGIDVALVEPGAYQTNIWSTGKKIAAKSFDDSSPYHRFMKKIEEAMEKSQKKYGDPIEVAKLIAHLALQKKIKNLRHPVGKGVKSSLQLKKMIPWHIWEYMFLKR